MFQKGSCYWQEYLGSIVTVTGKRTYDVTPPSTNYCATSRVFTGATTSNVTVTPKNLVSWDDTFNLTKCTAVGATPSLTIQSQSSSAMQNVIVTASIWLQADATLSPNSSASTPTDITLTLTDGAGNQAVTKTVTTPTGACNRFAISGYFTTASNSVKLKMSWTSPTGVVYMDACQIEISDYATEYINNTTSSALNRTLFASPDRMVGVGKYQPGTTTVLQDIFRNDPSLYPNERAVRPFLTSDKFFSNTGGVINTENVSADTHLIYRAKQIPVMLTGSASESVLIPEPWLWVAVQGAKAYQLGAMYDIGNNTDSATAIKAFIDQIEEMLTMSDPSPAYTFIYNNYARMSAY